MANRRNLRLVRRCAAVTGVVVTTLLGGLAATPAMAAPAGPVPNAAQDVGIPSTRVPADGRYIPPRTRGDREFDGHGPDVLVEATLVVSTRSINAQVHMRAKETVSDFTTAEGTRSFRLFTAPTGWCIRSVNVGPVDVLRYLDTDHAADLFPGRDAFSFVSSYDVMGDTVGDDAGVVTGVAVVTKSFVAHMETC